MVPCSGLHPWPCKCLFWVMLTKVQLARLSSFFVRTVKADEHHVESAIWLNIIYCPWGRFRPIFCVCDFLMASSTGSFRYLQVTTDSPTYEGFWQTGFFPLFYSAHF